MHSFTNLLGPDSFKLTYQHLIVTETFEGVIEYIDHFISFTLSDVAKPVLDVEPNNFPHHLLMSNARWITSRVVISFNPAVILYAMTWGIRYVEQYLYTSSQ